MQSPIKYLVCNADEGDPGAFMDRAILESDPHRVIEGMLIAAYAIGANRGYVYVRAEYPLAIKRLKNAIKNAERFNLLGTNIAGTTFNFNLEVRLGAGAYVCGEETALIASIEGKKGTPRPRPPYPAESGIKNYPTLINNVETYANISTIINNGSGWFASIGTDKSKGTKVFALSGNIKNTGLVEVPMGIKLYDLIFEIGGGIPNDKEFKAVQTGGPSGGCIPSEYLNTPVDYESLVHLGSIMGSGGMIVMDEDTCMVDMAKFFIDFCKSESCGKCAPCRNGTVQLYEILDKITKGEGNERDLTTMVKIANTMKKTSLCGLGQSAPNPVLSAFKYFKDEFYEHVLHRYCPAGVCKFNGGN
jgi:NADH:ubiquinone oxidoreductase subunit F (NADH-binding)